MQEGHQKAQNAIIESDRQHRYDDRLKQKRNWLGGRIQEVGRKNGTLSELEG